MTPPRSPRPSELDNRVWLSRQLRTKGTTTIALELGVSRGMVRKACERLGIDSHPQGPRRGVTSLPVSRPILDLSPTEQAIIDRIRLWRARRVPAEESTTLVAAIRGAHDARTAASPNAYDDALIDIAAASGLIHEHRQQLRRVA